MSKLIAIATVVAAGAVLVFAVAAGARGAATTNITIKGPNGDFSGKIKSSKPACLGDRKVIVYKLKGNGYDPENDTRVGTDTSEVHGDHGEWSIGNSGFKHGAFYALAKRSPGCKIGLSIPLQL